MAPKHQAAPRHTGLAIAAIVAIPFAAVTVVSRVADVASGTDPREALAGAAALTGGVVMGLLVRRLVRSVEHRVRRIAHQLVLVARRLGEPVAAPRVPHALLTRLGLSPAVVFVPAEVGRRGPPRSFR